MTQTQAETVTSKVVDSYFAMWNETDAAQRRQAIARAWSAEARYIDPMFTGEGVEGLDAMVAGVQQQFPGHRLRLSGAVDVHHDRARWNWELVGPDGGPPVAGGVDFAVLDVRLHGETVYGLAAELHRRRTPFIFATALDRDQILPPYRNVPLVSKPSAPLAVVEKIRQLEQPVVIADSAPLDEDDQSVRLARVVLKAIRGSHASPPLTARE